MAITKNLIVTLKDDIVELKDKMFIFRNDIGVEMIIELKDFEYSIDAIGNTNNFSKVNAIFRTPSGKLYSYNNIKVSSGKIRFVFTQDLIDVMQEIGEYELQFQLYDKLNNRLTIPSYNFYVKEPLCLPNEAIVGEGTVGFSYVAEDETYLFSIEDGYIKTEWEVGDLITKGKLNKIENAIFDVVNVINNMDITNNNPNLGNQHTHNNMEVLNKITDESLKEMIKQEVNEIINTVVTDIVNAKVEEALANFVMPKHTHNYEEIENKPNIPSIEGLATKEYVNDNLGGKKLIYLTEAEYNALPEEEKNLDNAVYNIITNDML